MERVNHLLRRILGKDLEPQSAPRRVAIDFDDTLIDSKQSRIVEKPVLRPGAERLLGELQRRGLNIILYTTASRDWVNLLFEDRQDLRKFFDRIYTKENSPRHKLRGVRDPGQRQFLESLDSGYNGGKDPLLVGAFVL